MIKLYKNYLNTFRGLSIEVWWLSLITLINRAGTLVIPFLSLYLTEKIGFTLSDVGWIMTAFGLGSVAGSWLGGKLTDIFGYYKIMALSLLLTGFMFIGLQFLKTFEHICIGIFFTMLIADTFRPAMFVALRAYSKSENKTRSVTLIRLAINLGVSAGPAAGGLIIAVAGYSGLFWIDGITCILATLLLFNVLNPKKAQTQEEIIVDNPKSVYKDKAFWIFFFAMVLFGVVFLQIISTLPVYYKDVHAMSEFEIGLLMSFNGLIIVAAEMPLIKWLEQTKSSLSGLMIWGALFVALSFVILNFTSWIGIVIISMLFLTLGEMICFPFSNAFAMESSKRGNPGEYLAMYSIAFSIAHIFGHNSGMQLIDHFGYDFAWYMASAIMIVCILLLFILKRTIISQEVKNE